LPGSSPNSGADARETTGADLLTGKQAARLRKLFASDAYVEVEATWGSYMSRPMAAAAAMTLT
jgi:hypothetical protein